MFNESNLPTINDTLYDTDTDESNVLLESSELIFGLTFTSWDKFKDWIYSFTLKEGFNYKIRISGTVQGVMRKATYECTKSSLYIPQVTSDLTKRHNTHFQQILCPWKLNVTCPKTSDIVKINSFNNKHNHPLTPIIREIAP